MATITTLQVGSYAAQTDTFTQVLDLNDRATYYLDTLDLAQPEKAEVRAFNIRTPGETIERVQYKNRKITATLLIRAANATALLAACHSLIAAIERPPYTLRLQLPGGSLYSYADVVRVTHDIPYEAKAFLAGAVGAAGKKRISILFECAPGLRGARQTLSNAVTNPGFEAPSGPGVTVFNDALANFNAYAVQAGGALAQDTYQFPDAVTALQGAAGATSTTVSVLRYYRLDETSGTTCYDASGQGQNGTTHGAPTQNVAGLLTGDVDPCYTFAAASSQYITCATTGLPVGNAPWWLGGWFKIAANPTASAVIAFMGTGTAKQFGEIFVDPSGKLEANFGGTNIVSAAAVSLNTAHFAALTWDGTTLTLYLDGTSAGTATPGALNLTMGTAGFGAFTGGVSLYWNGQLDECLMGSGCPTSTQITALYNAGHNAPVATANTLLIPNGGRVSFGSPAWGAINTWQVRFRWLTSSAPTFYLHYTDANDYLAAAVTGTALTVNHVVGGTTHQLGTQALQLVNGRQYWLQVTQFSCPSGLTPYISVQLFYDTGGAVGASVAAAVLAGTFDAVTALSGQPQMAASGAALGLGGNFSSVHTLALFGPGGWTWTPSQNGVSGQVSGAWDTAQVTPAWNATTYPSGPVTSFAAARMDLPPGGTVDALWRLYTGGAPAGTSAIPVQTAGNTLGYSVAVRGSGLHATNATVAVVITEYNASGTVLRNSGNLQAKTGAQVNGAWVVLSGSYTTGASCAFVDVALRVVDTAVAGESAGATVWWDNAQCWDQTRTGMAAMPYCELVFGQSPAQLLVSGLVGDVAAVAQLELGVYCASFLRGHTLNIWAGRRAQVGAGAQLVANKAASSLSSDATGATLDSASYSGYYVTYTGSIAVHGSLSPLISDTLGVYHYLARAWTSDATPASVTARVITDILLAQSWGMVSTDKIVETYSAYVSPYSAASTWTIADAGQLNVPPTVLPAQANPAALYLNPGHESIGTSGGDTWRYNWGAWLPVDGELYMALVNNASNAPYDVTAQWLYVYVDGTALGSASAYSVESAAIPKASHAAGIPGTQNTGAINVNPAADVVPSVDPRLTTPNSGGLGVNQYVVIAASDTTAPLPIAIEITYAPCYLYPQ